MAEGASSSGLPASMAEKAVVGRWQALRQELGELYSKIAELELELGEHRLVLGAIQGMDPSRRCFRMVGGVLVERTLGEVVPAVAQNKQGLEESVERLTAGLAAKKAELEGLEKKYNIRLRNMDEALAQQQQQQQQKGGDKGPRSSKGGSGGGVLVGPSS